MGRELKRVPLDFDAPLGELWRGYVNEHYRECPDCKNGQNPSLAAFEKIMRLLMLAGADSARRPADFVASPYPIKIPNYPGAPAEHHGLYPHPYLLEAGIDDVGPILHELTTGLAGEPPNGLFGYNAWGAMQKVMVAAGLDPETWGQCQTCKGEGIDPAVQAAYDAWTRTHPPTGDGYQLWCTTSEGSPMSPVFATLDELCAWCETNATTFADFRATKDEWRKMLDEDFVHAQVGNAVFI